MSSVYLEKMGYKSRLYSHGRGGGVGDDPPDGLGSWGKMDGAL